MEVFLFGKPNITNDLDHKIERPDFCTSDVQRDAS